MKNSNFENFPEISINGVSGFLGWINIAQELVKNIDFSNNSKIILECYQGVNISLILENLFQGIQNIHFIDISIVMKNEEEIKDLIETYVTKDPVFGYMCPLSIIDFFEKLGLEKLKKEIALVKEKVVVVYGTGASLLKQNSDLLLYADMPRWELQLGFQKNEIGNFGANNLEDEFSYKYKRAYFVDWRVCDKLKNNLFKSIDFILDTTIAGIPKMIRGKDFLNALQLVTKRPFRVVPFFDPGPWGGQWLKKVCDLDKTKINYAWGFDCVPEENSLLLKFENFTFETPAINLVLNYPIDLLGTQVFEAFGAEFPIRFDFLDTMDGGNLSLQVHPLKEYIHKNFGMNYTQDESYYFIDTKNDSFVYLGLKNDVEPELMIDELEIAQSENKFFNAEKFVAKWPIKKHDHILIPAGTVHCSGANNVVLEISATPYIFTFKLWDWGRMGLNGKPRPISLEHGKKSIQWDRTEDWVRQNLINQVSVISQGEGWKEEKTGLNKEMFIETRRHTFNKKVFHDTNGIVNVLNLVEGSEVLIESPKDLFEPYRIHFAETFIIPASVREYSIRPIGESEGQECITIKAFVKLENMKLNIIH